MTFTHSLARSFLSGLVKKVNVLEWYRIRIQMQTQDSWMNRNQKVGKIRHNHEVHWKAKDQELTTGSKDHKEGKINQKLKNVTDWHPPGSTQAQVGWKHQEGGTEKQNEYREQIKGKNWKRSTKQQS